MGITPTANVVCDGPISQVSEKLVVRLIGWNWSKQRRQHKYGDKSKNVTPCQKKEKKHTHTTQEIKRTVSGKLMTNKKFWTQTLQNPEKMPAFKLMNRHNKVNSPPAESWWQKKNKVNQYTPKLEKKLQRICGWQMYKTQQINKPTSSGMLMTKRKFWTQTL